MRACPFSAQSTVRCRYTSRRRRSAHRRRRVPFRAAGARASPPATAWPHRATRDFRAPHRRAGRQRRPSGSCAGCCGSRSARGRAAVRLQTRARDIAPLRRWRRARPAAYSGRRSPRALAGRCLRAACNRNATIDGDSRLATTSPSSDGSAGSRPRACRPAISPAPRTSTAMPPLSRSADGIRTSGTTIDPSRGARMSPWTTNDDFRQRPARAAERAAARRRSPSRRPSAPFT